MSILHGFRLDGRKAFVTGGARGIGKSAAVALAQAGADIAVVDVNAAMAEETAKELSAFGVKTLAVQADISSEQDVQAMIEKILSAFGTLDIAVNNAGICINKESMDMTMDEWRRVIDINLTGLYMTARAVAAVMMERGKGSIINTGSMAAHVIPGPQRHCAYSASKAGVIHLTKALAVEWARYHIRVNCVSPGYTATVLTKDVANPSWAGQTPLGRLGTPDDYQGAFIYLAGDLSSFVTGSEIIVDGGYCCQ